MLLFKLTIPMATQKWFKLLAIVHIIMAPMAFLFCFQLQSIQIPKVNIKLWMLILPISLFVAGLIGLFTRFGKSPPHFRV